MQHGEHNVAPTGAHRKIIVINQWWAGVLATVMASALFGGIAYAFQARADFAVLQGQVSEIRQANLPVRIAAIETQGQATAASVTRIERAIERQDDKLDKLLSR